VLGAALLALLFGAMPARAQEASEPAQPAVPASPTATAAAEPTPGGTDSEEVEAPSSTEQGHTQMDESFDRRPVLAILHESRLEGIRDTTINYELRSFYRHLNSFDDDESLAWTLGGSVGFKTGYFWHRLALGATEYTSQPIYAPYDKDGTQLLQPKQHPYTVLGELYGEFLLTDTVKASVGRRAYVTPYINTNDSRMTPATFQAYAIQGTLGGGGDPVVRFGAGYVDKEKDRNSEEFVPMSNVAGAPAAVQRGVYAAGGNVSSGGLTIGAMDYYSIDIINIAYTEAKYTLPIANRMRLLFSAQYASQASTGNNLLTGHSFSTDQFGLKAELALGGMLLTAAYTGTGNGANMQNPWGAYPGYTSVEVENFYRAGEDAAMLRAAYNFSSIRGLSAYALYVNGSKPDNPKQYAQDEYDLNVQWIAGPGRLKGLTLLARYGHVSQDGGGNPHQDDLRLVVYYDLP
jgi:hypothetical protein